MHGLAQARFEVSAGGQPNARATFVGVDRVARSWPGRSVT